MSNALSAQTAVLGLVHAMVFSDGRVEPTEVRWIHTTVKQHSIFAALSDSDFVALCGSVMEELMDGPLRVVVQGWVRSVPQSLTLQTFELAVGAALADGEVAEIEKGMADYQPRS